jgi:putative inorganic carbon (HCO3(-)) transporter
MLLILFGVTFSIIVNKNYYVGLGILKGWFLLPMIFAVIFYDNLKKNEKLLSWSFWAIFGGGTLVAIEGAYYWLSGFMTYDGRLRIFFDSPNQLAMYLAVVFLVGFLRFTPNNLLKLSPKESLQALSLVLVTASLYLTKSYGAWLAIAPALAATFWLKYRKIWQKKYLVVIVIIFIITISAAGYGKFEDIKNLGKRSSLTSREMIWKSAALMLKDNPLFGIGPGNFQNKYLEYQKCFPPYLEWAVPQPHNLYLAFWLEAGLAGLIGFLWLLAIFFRDNKNTRGNNPKAGLICLATILYFLLHGLIDTTYWRNDMAIVFWVVIAINLHLSEKEKLFKEI